MSGKEFVVSANGVDGATHLPSCNQTRIFSLPTNPTQPHKNDTLESAPQEADCCCPLWSVINDYIFKPIAKAWHSILSFFCSPGNTQEIPVYIITLDNISMITERLASREHAVPTFIGIIKWALQDPETFSKCLDEIYSAPYFCNRICNWFDHTFSTLIKLKIGDNKKCFPIDGALLSQDYINAMNEVLAECREEPDPLDVLLLLLIKASEHLADYPKELKALVPQMQECIKREKSSNINI